MRNRGRLRARKTSRLFLVLFTLPVATIGAALLDWTLLAAILAGAWVIGLIYSFWDMRATDRRYGTWGSDHTLGP